MALVDAGLEQRLQDITSEYLDFLDDDGGEFGYKDRIRSMTSTSQKRLIVNINHLRKKYPSRAQGLLTDSFEETLAFQRALKELVASVDSSYSKEHEEFLIGLEGSFGSKHVTPRTLTSAYLSSLVCVEGIVTKCSLVRPKVIRSVHYCPVTKKTIEKKYSDLTSLDAFPSSSVYPTKDEDGNLLETEYGLSAYKDHQTFSIQEMPERAPAGQLPRSVDVIVDDDLVDKCKPGDRVQVIGSFRCLPGKKNGYTSGAFRTVVIANNVRQLSKEVTTTYTEGDLDAVRKLAKHKGVFDLLAKSMAPSIHGHLYIKKAILCMLLGGAEKNLENGSRIRGDINVLLIGDPSVAKSQVLRYVLNVAPRAVTTTGRGSSGVGLTAAVTSDQETGERRLEAGAMVLADRGIVCIDEFDKMSDIDRTAIHEVMEQGRVTIAKAGIHAKLNARCSVLAAANPVYGRYDQHKTPMENIGLQDSLLSRFDLLFIVLDKNDQEQDAMIADHVLRMHRYRAPQEQEGAATVIDSASSLLTTDDMQSESAKDRDPNQIYEKYNALLHGGTHKRPDDKILSVQFLRKYLNFAKNTKTRLTSEAAEYIAEEYSKLRSQEAALMQDNVSRTQPITARTLETMIRLATAHAKSRLSNKILVDDAHVAAELVQYAYFKKVLPKERKRRRNSSGSAADDGDEAEAAASEDEENIDPAATAADDDSQPSGRAKRAAKRQRKSGGGEKTAAESADVDDDDPYAFDGQDDSAESQDTRRKRQQLRRSSRSELPADSEHTPDKDGAPEKPALVLSAARQKQFRSSLFRLFDREHVQSLGLNTVREFMAEEHQSYPFTNDEIMAALMVMADENMVMVTRELGPEGCMIFLV